MLSVKFEETVLKRAVLRAAASACGEGLTSRARFLVAREDHCRYDDRVALLWRKPYLDGAVRELTAGDDRSVDEMTMAIEQAIAQSKTRRLLQPGSCAEGQRRVTRSRRGFQASEAPPSCRWGLNSRQNRVV